MNSAYKLISSTLKGELNYKAFENINYLTINQLKKAFKAKKGKFEIYFFISEFSENSFDGTIKTFHDFLILKVNPRTKLIIDGYQYTLEWTDSPSEDLCRVTMKTEVLSNNQNIDALKMELVSPEDGYEWKKSLKDNGMLKLF